LGKEIISLGWEGRDAAESAGNDKAVRPIDLRTLLRDIMAELFQSISKRYKKSNTMTVVIDF